MRDGKRSLGRASFWCSALLMIAMGAIVLLIPAFINGFPLVYEDSVDYLIFTPRLYRSPFYGIFLTLFHWNRFIWAPIFAQALIVSHLIWVLVRIFPCEVSFKYFCIFILFLHFFY